MGRISLELVPREKQSFLDEIELVRKEFPRVDTLNIPDILKFEMRIPQACELAAPYFKRVIPHIRAVSVSASNPFPYKDFFIKNKIKETLVILGDNPAIVSKSTNPCDSIALIKKIKNELPGVRVYAGLDPYRTSPEEELLYARRKMASGADGFFTQPFFDLGLMEFWMKELGGADIFWGLAPVIRESARKYWENDNKVFFPETFKCTMEWNRAFAKDVLDFINETGSHVYFMPITVDVVEYLNGLI